MTKFSNYTGMIFLVGGVILYTIYPQLQFIAKLLAVIGCLISLYLYLLAKVNTRIGKLLRYGFRALTISFFISFLVVEAFIFSGMTSDITPKCSYVIVLGAGLSGDKPSVSLLGRLEAANCYLRQNPQAKVIASGGVGKESIYSEAAVMELYLQNHGITSNRILREEQATRTEENFKFGKQAIQTVFGDNPNAIVIATSDYHMFRSRLIAAKYYEHVYGIAAASPPLIKYNYAVREYFALIKMGLLEITERYI